MTPEVVKRVVELEKIFRERRWTLALAESCTGGLISSWICSQAGVSSFYRGGVVSYAKEVKSDILHVPKPLLFAHGEVSLATARAMASGVREVMHADWGLSVTGVAGPSGGAPQKPVGFVCFSVVGPGFEETVQRTFKADGGRQEIQQKAALFAFDLVLNAVR